MSIAKPVEQRKKDPAELLLSWSQKGLYFRTEENGEAVFHEIQTPFECTVLECLSYFNKPGKGHKKYYRSAPFKSLYDADSQKQVSAKPIKMMHREEDGAFKPMAGDPMSLDAAKAFAEEKGMRRGDLLYCYNEELGFFRLKLEGMASGELYLARAGVNDYELENHKIVIAGGYEKENPNDKNETVNVPAIAGKPISQEHKEKVLSLARDAGIVEYILSEYYPSEKESGSGDGTEISDEKPPHGLPETSGQNPSNDLPI